MKKRMKLRVSSAVDYLTGLLLICIYLQNYNEFLEKILYIPTIIIGIFILMFELSAFGISKKIYVVSCEVLILALINIIFVKNINITFLVKFSCEYLPVALWLLYGKRINNKYWFFISVFITLATVASWLTSYDNYSIMNGLSRNYVSIFLLVSVFIITLIFENKGKNVPIYVPIAYMGFSILAIGRMGILASLLYCVLFSFVYIKRSEKYTRFKIIILLIILILLLMMFVLKYDVFVNKLFSRFFDSTALNSNDGRLRLYLLYLEKMFHNPCYFVLGVKISEITKELNFIQGNLHSSFLQVHASMGIFGLLGIVYYLKKSFLYLFKVKNYYEIIYLIVFLFRISTDYSLCGFITDIILIYYVLMPIAKRKQNVRNTEL